MINKFLNSQTKSISFASLILAISYLASAFLGLLRDHLLAGKFGAGNELDVYYTAFTVPDFIALILVFGAISAAIVPIFSSYYTKSKEEAWQYVANLINIFFLILIFICVILMLFAPLFISWVAPGFSEEKRETTVLLMRIMFLSPIILGLSNIISGILQFFQRFLVTALAPLMYNLGIILGIVFFVNDFGLAGLAMGVVCGALLHLAIQVPVFVYSGFRYKKLFNIKHPGVLKTLKLMAPRSLGLAAGQFNTIVITAIASTLSAGSVAIFNLANNLSSMLVNTLAVSLSTAIFPSMAHDYSKDNKKSFEKKFSGAFRQIIFLLVPVSILIFSLRAQIVRVILGSGKFSWLDTRLTAACLGVFAAGLCFQGLIFILSKTFYAAHNTKIPATISFITVVFNIFLSWFFVWLLSSSGIFYQLLASWLKIGDIKNIKVVGLVLAFSVTAMVEALLLLYFLYKKIQVFRLEDLASSIIKIGISSAALFFAVTLAKQFLVNFRMVNLQTFVGVLLQGVGSAVVGMAAYLLVSYILKSRELKMIKESFFQWMK